MEIKITGLPTESNKLNKLDDNEVDEQFITCQFISGNEKLILIRRRMNLKQQEICEILGVRPGSVSQIENGRHPMGVKMAKRIEKAFGYNYKNFL